MQSNGNMYTAPPDRECLVRYSCTKDKWTVSSSFAKLEEKLGLNKNALAYLLASTEPGLWPFMADGNLLQAVSAVSGNGEKTVIVSEADGSVIVNNLVRTTGSELLVLSTATGEILGLSEKAAETFKAKEQLSLLFDSFSSSIIEVALRKCILVGYEKEFLVSVSDSSGERINYAMRMRLVPAPGRLIISTFSIPSVAVVSNAPDCNSLSTVLLEESFCPDIVIDNKGKILSANGAARNFCRKHWGLDPAGHLIYDLIHPDQRKFIRIRHQHRVRGNAVPSRYTVKLQPEPDLKEVKARVSVMPLAGTDRWILFLNPVDQKTEDLKQRKEKLSGFAEQLRPTGKTTPEKVLAMLTELLEAESAVWICRNTTVTAGDCTELLAGLDRKSLAARGTGFLNDSTFVKGIDSGYGLSHMLIYKMTSDSLDSQQVEALETAAKALEIVQLRKALEEERSTLSLIKDIAGAFLKQNESLEGILGDFARNCGAETAALLRIAGNGRILQGMAGSGLVGGIPDIQLDKLNTASWACLSGETALFTGSQDSDLRFSRVFTDSITELAVPFFKGTAPEGVILIASTGSERFNPSAAELAELLALLFTVPEESMLPREDTEKTAVSSPVREKAAEHINDTISAMIWTLNTRLKLLPDGQALNELMEISGRLGFYSKWSLWFLSISMYGGKPEQKWIDPVPLLEKTFTDMKGMKTLSKVDFCFLPPENDIEVCTDGAFVGMIASSLMMCILENSSNIDRITMAVKEKGDNWTFSLESEGSSIPAESLSTSPDYENRNTSFMLAWKLTEELGGTVSTFSNRGKSTRMVIRLRTGG
ncbi:hypothetical protein CSA37_11010 [Candidatus Fermentibacteria bacterium]|nr:MAG: hypothetical protein CSA37_11010 [Candidatus Fermentibacteria bacterium]